MSIKQVQLLPCWNAVFTSNNGFARMLYLHTQESGGFSEVLCNNLETSHEMLI